MRLENSYTLIKDNPQEELAWSDYWNVAMCYAYMDVDRTKILNLLLKAQERDNTSFCKILNTQNDEGRGDLDQIRFYKILGDHYRKWISDCTGIVDENRSLAELYKEKSKLDLTGLNEPLIDRLLVMSVKDQMYRGQGHSVYMENRLMQEVLDREVENELIEIFEEFGYPTKELVGESYSTLGCLLLEHTGQPKTQEKYLEMVSDAFQNDRTIKPYFKMLLDRYYWRTTGKQIFGSHAGHPFHNDKFLSEVKNKYGFVENTIQREVGNKTISITIKEE